MRALATIAAAAAAMALASCGGGGSSKGASVPESATTSPTASAAKLPPAERVAVERANAEIAAYCGQASKSLDGAQQSLPSPAADASVHQAVSSLIAVGKAHPREMDGVLFQAQKTLQAGCYPSQGEKLNSARMALGD